MKLIMNFSTMTDAQVERLFMDIQAAKPEADMVTMTWRYTTSCGTLGLDKYAHTMTPLGKNT